MVHLDVPAVRRTWRAHGQDAADELGSARSRTASAGGHDLDGVSATVLDAADGVLDVLDVVLAVLEEHREGVAACIADFRTSDGNTAGRFDALAR